MRSASVRISWCVLGSAVLSASIVSVRSTAQQPVTGRVSQHRSSAGGTTPIAMAHATFERAARIMESALPIYDGHRVRAIKLAKLAAREIKDAAMGTTGTGTGAGTPRKSAAQQAAGIPKGRNESLAGYNAQQIAASNAKMQEGMQLLQQGLQQVQSIGNDRGNHMSDAAEFGNYAIQAANQGLAFVQGKM